MSRATQGGVMAVPRVFAMKAAAAPMADEALPTEAGSRRVTISVNGSIVLTKQAWLALIAPSSRHPATRPGRAHCWRRLSTGRPANSPNCSVWVKASDGCFRRAGGAWLRRCPRPRRRPGRPPVLHQWRQHPAGADGVDGDGRRGRLQRHGLGQTNEAMRLAATWPTCWPRRRDRAPRPGLMMRPQPLVSMPGQGQACGVEGAGEVDGDDRVPALGRSPDGCHADASVVDQHVHAAELGLGIGHQRCDGGRIAMSAPPGSRPAASPPSLTWATGPRRAKPLRIGRAPRTRWGASAMPSPMPLVGAGHECVLLQ